MSLYKYRSMNVKRQRAYARWRGQEQHNLRESLKAVRARFVLARAASRALLNKLAEARS